MVARLTNLENLLIEQLQDLYSAENQQIVLIPRLTEDALSPSMSALLDDLLQGTKAHVRILEHIFAKRIDPLRGRKCQGMEGILQEAISMMHEPPAEQSLLEAGMLASLVKAKTYQIAGYSTAVMYATELGEEETAASLNSILDEERRLHKRLERLMKTQTTQAAEMTNQ